MFLLLIYPLGQDCKIQVKINDTIIVNDAILYNLIFNKTSFYPASIFRAL
jgi:hypothetical protein